MPELGRVPCGGTPDRHLLRAHLARGREGQVPGRDFLRRPGRRLHLRGRLLPLLRIKVTGGLLRMRTDGREIVEGKGKETCSKFKICQRKTLFGMN